MIRIYFNQIDLATTPKEIDHDAPFIDIEGTKEHAAEIAGQLLETGIIDSYLIPAFYSESELKYNPKVYY